MESFVAFVGRHEERVSEFIDMQTLEVNIDKIGFEYRTQETQAFFKSFSTLDISEFRDHSTLKFKEWISMVGLINEDSWLNFLRKANSEYDTSIAHRALTLLALYSYLYFYQTRFTPEGLLRTSIDNYGAFLLRVNMLSAFGKTFAFNSFSGGIA